MTLSAPPFPSAPPAIPDARTAPRAVDPTVPAARAVPGEGAEARGGPAPRPAERDRVIDLVRAFCLVVVVLLHGLMAGIGVETGEVRIVNAFEGRAWFAPVSWLVQIMPLFFVVGGFSGLTQWRRMRERGASAAEFVRGRVDRLVFPALLAFGTIGLGLSIAAIAGVPSELLGELGFRMAQPMWFLGVYLGAAALVPLLARAHERMPVRTLLLLVVAVVAVDILRDRTGVDGLGFLNLAFVWLAIQQAGFWYADGWFANRSRGELRFGVAACLGVLLFLTASRIYSADMLVNLNPPTAALLLLGGAQLCLLALLAPRLERWMRDDGNGILRRTVDAIGARSMTVYLWHMPVLVLVAAALLVTGAPWPEPTSAGWWMSRRLWLGAILVALVPVAAWLGRLERGPASFTGRTAGPISAPRAALSVVCATAGVVTVLVGGFTVVSAAVATTAFAVALWLSAGARSRRLSAAGPRSPRG
ncbi:acyltransferase family protein [Compostimonas suwonensis]|uniref:Acyltransferase-like protein n=1 Tax=Compostimonas suwonensis TaxID=1048394 RepID=A0A2M9BCT5_9MICO|nr:acyltransferase [Compostimonas suwonensis]PJJ55755.1 acyltransferase-like protein [Compostimonas suwonensis]